MFRTAVGTLNTTF